MGCMWVHMHVPFGVACMKAGGEPEAEASPEEAVAAHGSLVLHVVLLYRHWKGTLPRHQGPLGNVYQGLPLAKFTRHEHHGGGG